MKLKEKKSCIRVLDSVLAFLTLGIPAASGDLLTYPGASPCNTTLQACIGAAMPGDSVEVATNGPISEDLIIDISLTVRAAAGFSPVLDDFAVVTLVNPEPRANSIVFEGFTFNPGFLQAVQTSTNPFDVRIRDLTITSIDRPPIEVRTDFPGPYGAVTFEITGNDITIPNVFNNVQGISAFGGNASTFQGTIRDNTIVHLAGGQNSAIGVFNDTSDLAVDVIGNTITGSNYNEGITLFQFGPGSADVRIINNLVAGQVDEAGRPAAVSISIEHGDATFLVLNNTLADSESGISIGGRDDLGATWAGIVANNIVANMSDLGIGIDDPFASVINEYNLVFNTGVNFYTPGPGTLFDDPQFVGGGDYRLTPGSPARDAGSDARVPGDVTVDLDGNPRVFAAAVDMGAYELAVLPGDYNQNGVVDAADYVMWRSNVGAPEGALPNDVDGGEIGQAQYDTWRRNFGLESPLLESPGNEAVPEPASAVLVLLGIAVACLWARPTVPAS